MDTPECNIQVCRACEQSFPLTLTFFRRESRNRSGFKTRCIACEDAKKSPCAVEGCVKLAAVQGWCRNHYYRFVTHGTPEGGRPLSMMEHEPTCLMPGCTKPYSRRGLCIMHATRLEKHGDAAREPVYVNTKPCQVEGCPRLQRTSGYCARHYNRLREHGDPTILRKAPKGSGYIVNGYRVLFMPDHPNAQRDGLILEHRLVMADMLGRPLLPGETVHHKNGNRLDNHPDNLELWCQSQPAGQRVIDLLAWAHAFIQRYRTLADNPYFAADLPQSRSQRKSLNDPRQLVLGAIAS